MTDTPTSATDNPFPNDTLAAALQRSRLDVAPDVQARLESFATALWDWNERMNLTRHTTWEKFVTRDVVDAWQLNLLVPPDAKVLDVGTGGGVPGGVMAILRPDLKLTLCDPVAKKMKAVTEMAQRCQLPVRVLSQRAEAILAKESFAAVVVRAVAPLEELLKWFNPVSENIGRLLIVKGPKWIDERAQARHLGRLKPWELRKAASYPFPGTESESVILKLWPKGLPDPDGDSSAESD